MEIKQKEIFGTKALSGKVQFGTCYDPQLLFVMPRDPMIDYARTLGIVSEKALGSKMISHDSILSDTSIAIMTEKTFFSTLYLLVVETLIGEKMLSYRLKKNKYYMFKIWSNTGESIVARLIWNGDSWGITFYDMTYSGSYFDPTFLYF